MSGALAGTVDVDPISLSMATLARRDPEEARTAARAIEIAVLSNTLVKGAITLALGSPILRRTMLPLMGILAAACVAGMWIT